MDLKHLSVVFLAINLINSAPSAWAQQAGVGDSSSEMAAMKAQLAEQQKQIEALRKTLEQMQQLVAAKTPERSPAAGEVASLTPVVPAALPAAAAGLPQKALTIPAPSQAAPAEESPLQLHIGGATLTPVGFMDLTNTWRSTNSGATLATNFGNYPYNNTPQGRLSEDRFSAQNSRIGFRIDANFKGTQILGYYEGDFIGGNAGLNTQVSTNSMTYRLRLFWVNLRKGKWEMQAGQSWSMLDANRVQMSALPGDIFYGAMIDINYLNGLTLGRYPRLSPAVSLRQKWVAGIALAESEQYIGGSGGGGTPTLPAALSASNFNNEVNNGNTNTSVPNVAPDIIAKIVYEPSSRVHWEVSGVERTFKTFMPSTQAYFTKVGGGVGLNGNVEVVKGLRLITNNFWSDGGGRYIFGVAPDMIIRADGSPSLVHAGSTVDGFEVVKNNTQFYGYYGGVFIDKDIALDTNKSLIGYGYSGSPNSQNRTTQELTGGFTHVFWKDPRYGALSYMFQYAYFFRNPWYVAPNNPKNAHEHTVFMNLRYTLPGSAPKVEH